MGYRMINLPEPKRGEGIKLNDAIDGRYSCRKFLNKKLNLEQISSILWAACGPSRYKRTIPSAGATYPLELYLVVGKDCLEGADEGVYYYNWRGNLLRPHLSGDLRDRLAKACLGQVFVAQAPVSIVIAADYNRTTSCYGERGRRYVHMEVGHCCQNIHLEVVSLGLGTVVVGAFQDQQVKVLLELEEEPLAVMPIGYPR